jgi:hypothetical protein
MALAAISLSLGAVAYAATRPEGRDVARVGSKAGVVKSDHRASAQKWEERLPKARLLEYPKSTSTAEGAKFRFHVAPRAKKPVAAPRSRGKGPWVRRFQCRIDAGPWGVCRSPYRLVGLALGHHSFKVRALTHTGHPGPVDAYSWQRVQAQPPPVEEPVDSKPFSIEFRSDELEDLYPGAPAQQLPIALVNPNPVPIEVTSISVAITSEPPTCPAQNFDLGPSNISPSTPVLVPAGGSVNLPSGPTTAPTIRMLDLPENQDSCRGVEVQLAFLGEAHG